VTRTTVAANILKTLDITRYFSAKVTLYDKKLEFFTNRVELSFREISHFLIPSYSYFREDSLGEWTTYTIYIHERDFCMF
jgi:hypothetical protein